MSTTRKKVFLGGTVADTDWRETLIAQLEMDYFNPVVKEWNDAAWEKELYEREHCDINLYVLSPKQIGYYSLAEVVDDSWKRPQKTVFCYLPTDKEYSYTDKETESLNKTGVRVENNGGIWCKSLAEVSYLLNGIAADERYLKNFRSIQESAITWSRSQQPDDLLRGFFLEDARRWFGESEETEGLPPTRLMRQYFQKSLEESKVSDRPNVFVSYARNPSLPFATALFEKLAGEPYRCQVWFDKANIRAGVDYRDEISVGIERSGNFIFIISPRAVTSPHTGEELELAKKYSKRILPIQHIDPEQDSDIDADIRDIHRVFVDPALSIEQNAEKIAATMAAALSEGHEYINDHTHYLLAALDWERTGFQPSLLLRGKELVKAFHWLRSARQQQVPTLPSLLHGKFICRSRWEAANHFADLWIIGMGKGRSQRRLEADLNRKGIVTASAESSGQSQKEINLLRSSKALFLITAGSSTNEEMIAELELVHKYKLPVLGIVLEPGEEIPERLDTIDYSKEEERAKALETLISYSEKDAEYFELVRYLRYKCHQWQQKPDGEAHLVRQQLIEHYEVTRDGNSQAAAHSYPPIEEYLGRCKQVYNTLGTEVFIIHQATDEDFAFRLNEKLNDFDKVTWSEQKYLGRGSKATEQLLAAMELAENVVVVVSDSLLQREKYSYLIKAARESNKRILLATEDSQTHIPGKFSDLPLLDFSKDFEQESLRLLKELNTDHEHVRYHTRLQTYALQWDNEGRPKERLLIGNDLTLASAWLSQENMRNPRPTALQNEFIAASRLALRARTRRKRLIRNLIVFLGLLSIGFGIYAFFQRREAISNFEKAEDNRKEAVRQRDSARLAREEAVAAQLKTAEALEKEQEAVVQATQATQRAMVATEAQRIASENERAAKFDALTQKEQAERLFRLSQAEVIGKAISTLPALSTDSLQTYAEGVLKAWYINRNDGGPVLDADLYQSAMRVVQADERYQQQNLDLLHTDSLHKITLHHWHYDRGSERLGLIFQQGADFRFMWSTINRGEITPQTEEYALRGIRYVQAVHAVEGGKTLFLATLRGAYQFRPGIDEAPLLLPGTEGQYITALASAASGNTALLALKTEKQVLLYSKAGDSYLPLWSDDMPNAYENSLALQSKGEGFRLLTASGRSLHIYDITDPATRPEAQRRSLSIGQVSSVAMGKDNGLVVAGTDKGIIYVFDSYLREAERYQSVESSIRKITVGRENICSYSLGNQLQNARVVMHRINNPADPAPSEDLELDLGSSTIKDLLYLDERLYLMQNQNLISKQVLDTRTLISVLCQRYIAGNTAACERFTALYSQAKQYQDIKYCESCQ